MKATVFDTYSKYYDLLYRDKKYHDEVSYVVRLLENSGINKGDLLEFGSGTGKHGRLLAASGYNVHGIERSAEMVALAEVINGFTCQQDDICAVKIGRTYDAVLSLFHVISYQTSITNVQAVFARASEHLNSGGLFIFDFWYSPAVYAQRPSVRVKRMADETIEVVRIAEPTSYPNENRVDVHYTIYTKNIETGVLDTMTESHPMRHFSLPELDLFAEGAGFERIAAEEFMTGQVPSEGTWGVCVILKKV